MINILLIDDDELELKIIGHMLKGKYGADFLLRYAATLEDAHVILKTQKFDVILLDDKLSDGSTALENVPALRSAVDQTPLCIISKNIDAQHLRDKTILDVYDIIDKFDLRKRLEAGLLS